MSDHKYNQDSQSAPLHGALTSVSLQRLQQVFYFLLIVLNYNLVSHATDWPTYQHDNRRSAVTSDKLILPLQQIWMRQSESLPRPAWARPAKWDAYAEVKGLQAMRNYDHAFYTIAVDDSIWFGSSIDDAVHCIDANTGQERWAFFTDGAVRITPTWHAGKVYFGSDDGFVYCVDATTGTLIWKYQPAENDRLIPNNGKLISSWPCRTGVLIQEGKAYFGASLLPWQPSWLCAINAESGKVEGSGTFKLSVSKMTMEASMLASATDLYVLQGRSFPAMFQLADGKFKGVSGEGRQGGGVYGYLTEDADFVSGLGSLRGALVLHKNAEHPQMVILEGANRILISDPFAYLHSGKEISAFDHPQYLALNRRNAALHAQLSALKTDLVKKLKAKVKTKTEIEDLQNKIQDTQKNIQQVVPLIKKCLRWRVPFAEVHSFVLASDILLAGGDNTVVAIDTTNGETLWHANINGKALGLTVANGRLFVSTDTGAIYCFATN
ncbi:PQQ-binding-like beta-propeller repeat protein [uncultured Gimesia sp.]|uniref:PQQ-binding-like beta-propeller repeat protein n=1 Tax=uncultured Gimesia sp. TaxID=1678688 RepID=UPI0030D90395